MVHRHAYTSDEQPVPSFKQTVLTDSRPPFHHASQFLELMIYLFLQLFPPYSEQEIQLPLKHLILHIEDLHCLVQEQEAKSRGILYHSYLGFSPAWP